MIERKREGEVDRWRQGDVWGGNTDMGQLCYMLTHLHVHETGVGGGGWEAVMQDRPKYAEAPYQRRVTQGWVGVGGA